MSASVRERIRQSARDPGRDGTFDVSFQAMGTRCRLNYRADAATGQAFKAVALDWVADFEARYSRFLPDSLISRINQAAGREWVATDPETDRLLAMCHELHFLTKGVFDPTSLPLIRLWDWKADPVVIPTAEAIAAARQKTGWRKVQRAPGKVFLPEPGMALDLGGIGKEYAVDQIAHLALKHGISSVLVDFGADVHARGTPPDGRPAWHVGLEDPARPGKCWAGLAVKDAAVATSGDYLRHFEKDGRRYGHIIDVRTGQPVDNGCRAVSVIAPTCTLAGMLSTAAFVLGPEEGRRLISSQMGAEGCLLTTHGQFPTRRFYEYVVS